MKVDYKNNSGSEACWIMVLKKQFDCYYNQVRLMMLEQLSMMLIDCYCNQDRLRKMAMLANYSNYYTHKLNELSRKVKSEAL